MKMNVVKAKEFGIEVSMYLVYKLLLLLMLFVDVLLY